MAGELASKHSQADLDLVEVGTSDFYEDVLGVVGDLRRLRVNDRREGQNLAFSVVENGVLGLVLNDIEELLKFLVFLQSFEEVNSVHLLRLLQSLENDVLRVTSLIGNRSLNFVVVMSSH